MDRYRPAAPRPGDPLTARSVARLRSEGTSVLWVYFRDKGEHDAASFQAMVRDAGSRVGARSRTRRQRETGGGFVPDWYDVPVVRSYVEGVTSTGARVRNVLRWFNAVTIEADEPTARRVASLPYVQAIEPARRSVFEEPMGLTPPVDRSNAAQHGDAWSGAALPRPTDYGVSLTQLASINVPAVHDSGFSGAGVILCMIDTGYDKSHTALEPLHEIAEYDFIQHDGETANQFGDPVPQWNHGTGTWSVAGGYWPTVLVGPAYNAGFLLAKTENVASETHVEEDNWVAAAEWADALGADVISSSLIYRDFDPQGAGGGDYAPEDLDGRTAVITQAAVVAHRRGILVCNSVGNEGPNPSTLGCPADADSILSVGAVDASDIIAAFSSRGPTYDGRIKPEVMAQGAATYWATAGAKSSYATANGTSLSCPLVGGVAALVREAHPEWTNAQVRQALMDTADRAGAPDNNYGWGRIDARAAIYDSPLGGPVYPYPFDLAAPAHQSLVATAPVTLRWNRARDPQPGDAVTYEVTISTLAPAQCVFTMATPDTELVVADGLLPFTPYEWTVTAIDPADHRRESRDRYRFTTGDLQGLALNPPASPPRVILAQARPNPTRAAARIDYSFVGAPGVVPVNLRIYDVRGRLVRTLLENHLEIVPMSCSVTWDGTDTSGHAVPSGIYYYHVEQMGQRLSKRLAIIR